VQFAGPIHDDWLNAVRQTGARLLNYYPQFSYVVWASDEEIARARLVPQVAWAGEFAPGFKLSHELAAPFFLGAETALPAGPVQLVVCAVLADGANQQIFADLLSLGAAVDRRTTLDIYESARVTLNSDQVPQLIARGGVLSVEVFGQFHGNQRPLLYFSPNKSCIS
jgi:hypothetical protein